MPAELRLAIAASVRHRSDAPEAFGFDKEIPIKTTNRPRMDAVSSSFDVDGTLVTVILRSRGVDAKIRLKSNPDKMAEQGSGAMMTKNVLRAMTE